MVCRLHLLKEKCGECSRFVGNTDLFHIVRRKPRQTQREEAVRSHVGGVTCGRVPLRVEGGAGSRGWWVWVGATVGGSGRATVGRSGSQPEREGSWECCILRTASSPSFKRKKKKRKEKKLRSSVGKYCLVVMVMSQTVWV